MQASLPQLERAVLEKNHERALAAAIGILEAVDNGYGRLVGIDRGASPSLKPGQAPQDFCDRFAGAFGRMIAHPDFKFSPRGYETLLTQHRWLDVIFSLSNFGDTDHLLDRIAGNAGGVPGSSSGQDMLRMLAIRLMDSAADVDLDRCWASDRSAAAIAFLNYLTTRYLFTPRGLQFRERLLEWLPKRLDDVQLGTLTLSRVQDIYMHCSYAFTPGKHEIKAALMRQMRRVCLSAGCQELALGARKHPAGRPTVVVVLESYGFYHSVYRTHGAALCSLKERFRVVCLCEEAHVAAAAEFFDEHILYPAKGNFLDAVRTLTEAIGRYEPALVLHVGVGMSGRAIALASLRLAPVQCVSFGHTATTMSPAIDYMILPDDFVGSNECFSERVMALPKEAMPFKAHSTRLEPAKFRSGEGPVRVAIPASIMKLNALLLAVLQRIATSAKSDVEFHFLPVFATGLAQVRLARSVREVLPTAVVHPQAPFADYLNAMRGCDLFLCPFPYGNMNGIVDAVGLALPGVCLDGPEAHAHADAAIFARIGFPAGLVAQTEDEYVAAAVRLIDDTAWRAECRNFALACDFDRDFRQGDASLFCQAIADLIRPASARR